MKNLFSNIAHLDSCNESEPQIKLDLIMKAKDREEKHFNPSPVSLLLSDPPLFTKLDAPSIQSSLTPPAHPLTDEAEKSGDRSPANPPPQDSRPVQEDVLWCQSAPYFSVDAENPVDSSSRTFASSQFHSPSNVIPSFVPQQGFFTAGVSAPSQVDHGSSHPKLWVSSPGEPYQPDSSGRGPNNAAMSPMMVLVEGNSAYRPSTFGSHHPPSGSSAKDASHTGGVSNKAHSSTTNLFITRLGPEVTEQELKTIFSRYGEIINSVLMRNIHTGRSMRKAFVRFAKPEDAGRAMKELQGIRIRGDAISIQWANRQHDTTPAGEEQSKIRKVFIRNIPVSVTKEQVTALCRKYGEVGVVTVQLDTVSAASSSPNLSSPSHGSGGLASPMDSAQWEGTESASGVSHLTSNAPSPTLGAGKKSERRNIAFVMYERDGDAQQAVAHLHNTHPFPLLDDGVPLMVKLSETKKQRMERKKQFLSSDVNNWSASSGRRSDVRMASPTFLSSVPSNSESSTAQVNYQPSLCLIPNSQGFYPGNQEASLGGPSTGPDSSLFQGALGTSHSAPHSYASSSPFYHSLGGQGSMFPSLSQPSHHSPSGAPQGSGGSPYVASSGIAGGNSGNGGNSSSQPFLDPTMSPPGLPNWWPANGGEDALSAMSPSMLYLPSAPSNTGEADHSGVSFTDSAHCVTYRSTNSRGGAVGPGSSGSGALPPPIPSALPAGLPGSTPWTFTEGDPQDGSLSGNRSNYLQSFSVPAHPSGSSPGDLKESSALEEVTGSASPQQFWVVASGTPPSTPLGPAAVHSEQGGGNPQTLLPPGVQYYYTPSEIPKAGVAGLRESDELANALAGSEPLWTEVNGPGFEVAPDQPMNFLDSFVD